MNATSRIAVRHCTAQSFAHLASTPGEYTEKDISPNFWHNGRYPDSDEYAALSAGGFAAYQLRIDGLVNHRKRTSSTVARMISPRR